MHCCHGKMWAVKWLVAGLILILNQVYTKYDIWIVLGVLAIIKGLIILIMPHKEECEVEKKSSKRR